MRISGGASATRSAFIAALSASHFSGETRSPTTVATLGFVGGAPHELENSAWVKAELVEEPRAPTGSMA